MVTEGRRAIKFAPTQQDKSGWSFTDTSRSNFKTKGATTMQLMKWSVMALAIASATSQMAYAVDEADSKNIDSENLPVEQLSSQAQSNGFIEDADLTLLNRNFAFYRNFNHGGDSTNQQNYANEWAHAFLTTFTSGFTQGTVGFGIDAFGNAGLKLNSGTGIGGTGLLPADGSDCNAATESCKGQDSYGIAGGAVKARISETVLKFGQQRPASPVFAPGDSRLMPSYVTGTSIMSEEISDLVLQGGHFYSGSGSASTNQDGILQTVYGETEFNNADYVGGDYSFSDNLGVGFHAAQYEDVWNQYYADLYHTFELSEDMSLSTSLNYYKTVDSGKSNAGKIDNNTFSGAIALSVGAQTFTVAHQRVNGDTPFDYLNVDGSDGDSIWLANASQYSDFNAPGEKSYKAQYDIDLSDMVMPGLSFMARYVSGSGADGTNADINGAYNSVATGPRFGHGGDEWERDIEVKYVVQEGAAKDLSFRVRQATWRSNGTYDGRFGKAGGSTGLDEIRLITEYPLDIL